MCTEVSLRPQQNKTKRSQFFKEKREERKKDLKGREVSCYSRTGIEKYFLNKVSDCCHLYHCGESACHKRNRKRKREAT